MLARAGECVFSCVIGERFQLFPLRIVARGEESWLFCVLPKGDIVFKRSRGEFTFHFRAVLHFDDIHQSDYGGSWNVVE